MTTAPIEREVASDEYAIPSTVPPTTRARTPRRTRPAAASTAGRPRRHAGDARSSAVCAGRATRPGRPCRGSRRPAASGWPRSRLRVPSSRSVATDRAMVWKLVRSTPAATMPARKNPAVMPRLRVLELAAESPRTGEQQDQKGKAKMNASFSREYCFSSSRCGRARGRGRSCGRLRRVVGVVPSAGCGQGRREGSSPIIER